MRGRSAHIAITAATLVLAAGCTSGGGGTGEFTAAAPAVSASPSVSPSPVPPPSPLRSVPPASSAGGLCAQLDYAAVEKAIGVRFAAAAATGTPGHEQVCTLQPLGDAGPDLTLALAPVSLDSESFKLDYSPKDAKPVAGLGLAAYSRLLPGGQGTGPAGEIGWLTKQAVLTLTFTTTPGAPPATATAAIPGLIAIAKAVR